MAKQNEFNACSGHGGNRKGAGRPSQVKVVSRSARPPVNLKKPLHITLKLAKTIPDIRRTGAVNVFIKCAKRAAKFKFNVIQFAVMSNHIHFIAEAADNSALGKGMQSLASSFAKALKKEMRKWSGWEPSKGAVFNDRYHLELVNTPTQMKNTLKYVLLNACKHFNMIEHMDEYSSAATFGQWRELLGKAFKNVIAREARRPVADLGLPKPQSWLAREGWLRAV